MGAIIIRKKEKKLEPKWKVRIYGCTIKQKHVAHGESCEPIKTIEYVTGDGLSFTAWTPATIVNDEPVEPETGKKGDRKPEARKDELINSNWSSDFRNSFFPFLSKTTSRRGLAFGNRRYWREGGTQVFFVQTCLLPLGSLLVINTHH